MTKRSFQDLLLQQAKFSNDLFDVTSFTDQEVIEKHKTFCLALHSEVTQLADAVHYKEHRKLKSPTDRQKILYESVDIIRYALAGLNLWGFTSDEFIDAFDSKDASLWDKKNRSLADWSGEKVVIVDVDDVLARFREGFFEWLNVNFGLELTPDLPEYYYSGPTGSMSGEQAFMKFIDEGGFRNLQINQNVLNNLKSLKERGYWIQLLTARPGDNLKCMYDTYWWLANQEIPYDNIAFSFEKYRWLSDKPFYMENKVVAAIDDSPKHASEYASQGIRTFVPKRSYNEAVWESENISVFDWESGQFHGEI
tara:strand:+ start:652 stop:1578 length:927 start_codon:yes stop_codon:yes gene_type:complete